MVEAVAAVGGMAMDVIISSHASLGAVYLMGLLREECRRRVKRRRRRCGEGDDDDRDDDREDDRDDERTVDEIMGGVRITAWGTTVVMARRTSETSVRVPTVRGMVDVCTMPSFPPPSPPRVDDHRPTEEEGEGARCAWGRSSSAAAAAAAAAGPRVTTTTTTIAAALVMDVATPATADAATAFVTTTTTATATTATTRTRTKCELLLNPDGLSLCAALFGPCFRNWRGVLCTEYFGTYF